MSHVTNPRHCFTNLPLLQTYIVVCPPATLTQTLGRNYNGEPLLLKVGPNHAMIFHWPFNNETASCPQRMDAKEASKEVIPIHCGINKSELLEAIGKWQLTAYLLPLIPEE